MNRGRARGYDSPRGRSSPSAGRFSPRNSHMTGSDGSYSDDSFSSRGGRSRGRRGNASHMSPGSFQRHSNTGPKPVQEYRVKKPKDENVHTEGVQLNQSNSNVSDGDSKRLDSSVASIASLKSKESRFDETEVGSSSCSNSKLGGADQRSREQSAKSVGSPGDPEHSDEAKQLHSSVALDYAKSLSPSNPKERQLDETEAHIGNMLVKGDVNQPSREQCAKSVGRLGDPGHSHNQQAIERFDICLPKTGGATMLQRHSNTGPKRVQEYREKKPKDETVHTEGVQLNQSNSNVGDGDLKQLDSSVASIASLKSKESRFDETEVGSSSCSNSKLGGADQRSREQSAKSVGSPGDPEHSDEAKQLHSSVALDYAKSLAPSNPKERQLDETEAHIGNMLVKGDVDQPSREQCAKSVGRPGDPGHSHNQQAIERFDICLPKTGGSTMLVPTLYSINREKRNADKRALEGQGEILEHGMVLLKGYLSVDDQVRIVKQCRQLGLGTGGFYQPGYRDGAKLNLKMMCLGKNWDPNTSKYGERRPDDGEKPPIIPDEFRQLVERAMKDSRALVEKNSKGSNVENIIPWMSPDICIVNFYSASGRLGLHQDKDESEESLEKGLPVVSFSIGGTGEFLYGDSRDEKNAKKVLLESGDVLIFGGKSRHIFHGVRSVDPDTAPMSLLHETNLRTGRLNLTFRQY